jgi:hypothetical protein
MTVKQIREIARQKQIKVGNVKKDSMIRAIQRAEGNFDCFGTAVAGICDQIDCLWREDCLKR